jgi:hypothetical protein
VYQAEEMALMTVSELGRSAFLTTVLAGVNVDSVLGLARQDINAMRILLRTLAAVLRILTGTCIGVAIPLSLVMVEYLAADREAKKYLIADFHGSSNEALILLGAIVGTLVGVAWALIILDWNSPSCPKTPEPAQKV